MPVEALKVGELARRTRLTVRTLHHYDEIGLVKPSLHTEAGHRLYVARDIARLQQVMSLRQLGFSLEEVKSCLDRDGFAPLDVIRMHVARLREQIDLQQRLCAGLEGLALYFEQAGDVSAEAFLKTIEVMTMTEKYYTAEQMEYLAKRREIVGEERMKQAPNDWANLIAEYRAEMEKGTDPADLKLQALEKRRAALIAEFTGGDKGIEQSLGQLWKEQGKNLAAQYGYDPKTMEYMHKVTQAGHSEPEA